MNLYIYLSRILILSLVSSEKQTKNQKRPNLVYNKNGNITITGIFNGYTGKDCNVLMGKGIEEMASAIWTIEALNLYNFLPGIAIGLSLFDTCDRSYEEQKHLYELPEQILNYKEETVNFGIFATSDIQWGSKSLNKINEMVGYVEHIINSEMMVDLVVQLLTNIQWKTIDLVISNSDNILNSFSEKTSDEGICVRDELLINRSRNLSETIKNVVESKDSVVIVIFAECSYISNLLEKEKMKNETIKLILVPTDFDFSLFSDLTNDKMVLLPSMEDKSILSEFIRKEEYQKNFLNHKEPIKSPLFIGIASSIIKLLKPFQEMQDKTCKNRNFNSKQPCTEVVNFIDVLKANKTVLLPEKSLAVSPDDIIDTLKVLKIDSSSNDEMFLYITTVKIGNTSEDLAIFQIFDFKTKELNPILLMINDNLLHDVDFINKREKEIRYDKQENETNLDDTKEFTTKPNERESQLIKLGLSLPDRKTKNLRKSTKNHIRIPKNINNTEVVSKGTCGRLLIIYDGQNLSESFSNISSKSNMTKYSSPVVWRLQTWMFVNTCISVIGVTTILTIMFFLARRISRGDILEGSSKFIIFLMISVISIYLTSLIFHVEIVSNNHIFSKIICNLKMIAPPMVYTILFSLLLSRSLMLASIEFGSGIVNHINGYLQTILCFFIIGVQISLTYQQWYYEYFRTSICLEIQTAHNIITSLTYNSLLLIFLAGISPFIIRSKRNYKEGLYFSVSIFVIIVVWLVWVSFYFILPHEFKDKVVAAGLNSTGSVLLFFVFIPRTYLISSAIIQDKIHSLQSLDQNILSEVSNANYRSNQTLNDFVFGTITYKTSETGLSNPNFFFRGERGSNLENPNTESVLDTITNDS